MPKGKDVLAIMLGGKPKGKEEPLEEGLGEATPTGLPESPEEEGFASSLKDAIVTCVEEQNSGEY